MEKNFLGPKSLERLEHKRVDMASKQFSTDTALSLIRDDQSNQNSDVLLNRYRQYPNSLSATGKVA